MKLSRKIVTVLAASLFTAAVPMTAFGDIICHSSTNRAFSYLDGEDEGSDKKASADKDELDDSKNGPGMVNTEIEEDVSDDFSGPTVTKVALKERYHELYELYEESIADLFFLYANVGNGSITHERVTIDIPANVFYTMEKDGLPYEYVSKDYITQKGTYVMRLTACENPDMPMSEQIEYQSVFRFRIADEPPTEAAKEAEVNAAENQKLSSESIWGTKEEETEQQQEKLPEEKTEKEKSEEETTVSENKEQDEQKEEDIQASSAAVSTFALNRKSVYLPESGYYQTVLESGVTVVSNVPEGYVGPSSVELSLSDEDMAKAVLYKDDEAIEFANGESVVETGSYRLDAEGSSYHFTVAKYVNSMDYYPVPSGMKFSEVRVDGTEVALKSDQVLELTEEGSYAIQMTGTEGNVLHVVLEKDYTAPEASVSVDGGTAYIQYLSDDIAVVELAKDGKLVEGFTGTSVSDPGKYALRITDEAGNSAAYQFALKYHINIYGVLAVVLCIGVVAGLVVFVMHTKKNMKIR